MIVNTPKKRKKFEDLMGSRARVKILKTLAINEELSITQIINKTKLNYSCASKHLNYLKMIDLIQEKKFGRIKIFRYKLENLKARSLRKFIEIWEGNC
ncbi:MAG: winged helix-turn-helix transcriptional regulator [Candidatus Lokiarchaeota archaeon]|nr:winged helix-turn-helix transcriptional regulator [Candidatus Lokiarchaeota archaeon]